MATNNNDANSIVQDVIQIKNGIMINVNVSLTPIARAEKIIVGILAHVFVKIIFKKCCWWIKN